MTWLYVHLAEVYYSLFWRIIKQANLCGSSLGLYFSYHMERYYRHRREVITIFQCAESIYSAYDSRLRDYINLCQPLSPIWRMKTKMKWTRPSCFRSAQPMIRDPPPRVQDWPMYGMNARNCLISEKMMETPAMRSGQVVKCRRMVLMTYIMHEPGR